ncbi:PTS ascorbate transporter subunit IIC [[Clostridium] innocuum]|nr:PTS ascorbate transporter subunit IIC [Erysipelotrichaceae bacterium]MCR0381698.1 PTS ascorbate transporter subunit IIC [[Clostridium] innocuum]MCR0413186.1 PTS ascorbate transporter subunit IIC [[Clostridium] innocuum]MCR0533319.1 PTS ascorbate transporter subunit IIC [[Clostridium] innocuum]MCR0537385.1 PTS ascorbate transporter subunit IIC [[Clostridium] innocuum]
MDGILNTIVSLVRTPPMFIAIIAMLGLVLQKKGISDVVKGTLKSFIGMVILTQGVNVISNSIAPLSNGFVALFAIENAPTIGDFNGFLADWGSQVGLIMLIGFVMNILIARFTRFKTIFLTANLLYWYPMLFIAVGVENDLGTVPIYAISLLLFACVVTIMPHVMRKHVKMLTGQDTFTIGHTTSVFCLMGSWIGAFFGKNEKNIAQNTENINLPKGLAFCRDTTIVSGIVITLVYIIVALCIDDATRELIFAGQPFVTVSITNGMTFAAGMLILLQGVRMMLAEIVPAFKGIAMKLAPGSVPAMDVPLIFPYGQNALLIGFIIAAAVNIITIFVLGASGMLRVAVIPLMVACYFDVAPACIFANKRGGVKAVMVTAVLGGVILTVLCAVTIPMVAGTVGTFLQTYGGNEYSIWVIAAEGIAKFLALFGL